MNIYLAGGMKSNWQDYFIKNYPKHCFIDPRSSGLINEKDYTKWDLDGIQKSDLIIAYMDESNPSGFGLNLEVGYAAALNKKIIYICEDTTDRQRYFGMVRACANYLCINCEDSRKWIDYEENKFHV